MLLRSVCVCAVLVGSLARFSSLSAPPKSHQWPTVGESICRCYNVARFMNERVFIVGLHRT